MSDDHLICEHISVSRKQTWSECQQKYKFRYHLGMKPDVIQPYFTYGKVVHTIIEVYVQEQGKRPIEEICQDVLSGKIQSEGDGAPHLEPEYLKKLPQHLKNLKAFNDKIGYDGHLEWEFHYDLEPPKEHFITGFIDRLIIRGDKYFIIDYKTTKKGMWRKNKNTIRTDLQLRCYGRVVQKFFGAKPENIRAALFYIEGSELVDTRFTEQSLEMAEQELHEAYLHITSTHPDDVYGRTGDHCKRCDYRAVCPFYAIV